MFVYSGTQWARTPGLFGQHDFELSSTIEVKSEISLQLALLSEFAMDALLEAHRLAIADRMLEQVLAGSGVGNDLDGVVNATGTQSGTYAQTDRGSSASLQDAEDAIEDAGGRQPFMAWGAGSDLSTSTRRALLEPGSDRRVEERARLSLSGLPIQRITGLTSTTGLCGDWATIIVPVLDRIDVVTDRITNPGDVRITSRLAIADPIVSHPQTVYLLTQA